MSHHSQGLAPDMKTLAKQMGLGATGEFPEGHLNDDDEGEIKMASAHDPSTGKVIINFGKPTAWIGMSPTDARLVASSLIDHANRARLIGA